MLFTVAVTAHEVFSLCVTHTHATLCVLSGLLAASSFRGFLLLFVRFAAPLEGPLSIGDFFVVHAVGAFLIH